MVVEVLISLTGDLNRFTEHSSGICSAKEWKKVQLSTMSLRQTVTIASRFLLIQKKKIARSRSKVMYYMLHFYFDPFQAIIFQSLFLPRFWHIHMSTMFMCRRMTYLNIQFQLKCLYTMVVEHKQAYDTDRILQMFQQCFCLYSNRSKQAFYVVKRYI